ncbi:MAG: protein phosphatase 2C domain-containing protein [Proteobacteria bacterium]|nr:protein phosphatase 2C domain-containing protein [Pseudomonadota bacterium]
MQVYSEGATHIGSRRNNQDSIYHDSERLLFVVADGMGGHAGGEIASQMVVSHFKNIPKKTLPYDKEDREIEIFFERSLNQASCDIYLKSIENPTLREMGTTCSLLWMNKMKLYCAHAGDSRIYLQRNNFLYQLTDDHSLVGEQLRAGLITEGAAKDHVLKNVITRSIGYRKQECIDTFSQDLMSGDQLLVCSDGLYNEVSAETISRVMASDKKDRTGLLVDLARNSGEKDKQKDNISVIIVSIM